MKPEFAKYKEILPEIGRALSTFAPQENLLGCFHSKSEAPVILRPEEEEIPDIISLLDNIERYSVNTYDDLDSPEVRARQLSAVFLLVDLLSQINQLYKNTQKTVL